MEKLKKQTIEFYGDKNNGIKNNGIELRKFGESLDEVLVWKDNKCVVHIETMSDKNIWMGIYLDGFTGRLNFNSKNNRSHIEYNAEVLSEEEESKP